jgi:hypothetical protein
LARSTAARVVTARVKKRAADNLACRIEFARMLDGAHAREA